MRKGGELGPVIIKICGLGGSGDLNAAKGADMIGVVIDVPSSPRNRTWDEARQIFDGAMGKFLRVAVLVDPLLASVRRAIEDVGADLVQVHGRIPDGVDPDLARRIVPSLAVTAGMGREVLPHPEPKMPALPPHEAYPFLQLDVTGGMTPGGTGRTPDWAICHRLVSEHPERRFLLGGGLTPLNVVSAMREVGPAGVDVSSGVESGPGVKSAKLVSSFVKAVRLWEARHA